jgi:hypothetical protein
LLPAARLSGRTSLPGSKPPAHEQSLSRTMRRGGLRTPGRAHTGVCLGGRRPRAQDGAPAQRGARPLPPAPAASAPVLQALQPAWLRRRRPTRAPFPQVLVPAYRGMITTFQAYLGAAKPALVLCDFMLDACADAAYTLRLPFVVTMPTLMPGGKMGDGRKILGRGRVVLRALVVFTCPCLLQSQHALLRGVERLPLHSPRP